MAVNNAINSGALGQGFMYTDGSGLISSNLGYLVTKYTSSNTWTMNAKTQAVTVLIWGGGGGGGSGRQGSSTAAGGGGGGSSGTFVYYTGFASQFNPAGETVTIGGGGTGATGQTSAATNGIVGGACTVSSLGNISVGVNNATTFGGAGSGGTTTISTLTDAQPYYSTITPYSLGTGQPVTGGQGSNGAPTNPTQQTNTGVDFFIQYAPQVGGGGSGGNSGAAQQAANGGPSYAFGFNASTRTLISSGGAGGISTGTIDGGQGTNAITTTGGKYVSATGGGGGGGMVAGIAGQGGNGGVPGAGGGGGGGSITGTTSGAGGNGGRGELWVIEYF